MEPVYVWSYLQECRVAPVTTDRPPAVPLTQMTVATNVVKRATMHTTVTATADGGGAGKTGQRNQSQSQLNAVNANAVNFTNMQS